MRNYNVRKNSNSKKFLDTKIDGQKAALNRSVHAVTAN